MKPQFKKAHHVLANVMGKKRNYSKVQSHEAFKYQK